MKIDYLKVKVRFVESKVREIERPDVNRQQELLDRINAAMEELGGHIIDIEVTASEEE